MAEVDPASTERLKNFREEENKKKARRRLIWLERAILLPIFALVALVGFNVRQGQVEGRSMQPGFKDNEKFWILKNYKLLGALHIGDVVVVKRRREGERPDTEIVKRIVFIQNGEGNAPLPETMELSSGKYRFREAFPEVYSKRQNISPNAVLIMGDNVDNSTDSRIFGEIFPYEIVGKVILH